MAVALDLFRLRGGVGLRLVAMTSPKLWLAHDVITDSSPLHNTKDAPLFLLSTCAPPSSSNHKSFLHSSELPFSIARRAIIIEDFTPSWHPLILLSEAWYPHWQSKFFSSPLATCLSSPMNQEIFWQDLWWMVGHGSGWSPRGWWCSLMLVWRSNRRREHGTFG